MMMLSVLEGIWAAQTRTGKQPPFAATRNSSNAARPRARTMREKGTKVSPESMVTPDIFLTEHKSEPMPTVSKGGL